MSLPLQLVTPPGNNLSIDESLRAIITNRTSEPLEIYLKGTVRESQDGIIFEGTSSVITLPEGSENLNQRNIDKLEPFETRFLGSDYENYVLRTSEFPPGEYEVCVQVILAEEERVIAEACYEKTIEDFLPPSLISPENRTKVSKSNPFSHGRPLQEQSGNITSRNYNRRN
ncbi:MAG: hypothetical protein U5L09_14985 [Bacteroidales bacterium]|nr:hypothetical protein [Bacteroidales bacterium]